LLPLLYTSLKTAGIASNHSSFLVCTLPSYAYILYYAISGYKAGKTKTL